MASFNAIFPVLQELFAKNHRGALWPPPCGARVNRIGYSYIPPSLQFVLRWFAKSAILNIISSLLSLSFSYAKIQHIGNWDIRVRLLWKRTSFPFGQMTWPTSFSSILRRAPVGLRNVACVHRAVPSSNTSDITYGIFTILVYGRGQKSRKLDNLCSDNVWE